MPEDTLVRSVALPIGIDLAATVLFSMTGAMVAIRRHYDSVGLFVIAMVCGLGGGLLRDGIFIQAGPPAAMRDGSYMIAVLVGCLAAIWFFPHVERFSRPFLILDALGIAAYGVVGASKSWEAGLAIPACIFVGVVNAAGSSLLRDVLVREEPLLFKPGQYYVIASVLGVSVFTLLASFWHARVVPAALCGIAVTFIVRLLAILFDWKTKPLGRMLSTR